MRLVTVFIEMKLTVMQYCEVFKYHQYSNAIYL